MLKTLIKKQFFECFRGYFVNQKTGKARSKFSQIMMFVLFAALMLLLSVAFIGMAFNLKIFLNTELEWLYFAISSILAIALGVFASVFNTYTTLYQAKDNEMLLAMPIKPKDILISRIFLVFGLCLLYSSIVWLPICIYSWFCKNFGILAIVFQILILFLLTLFNTAISCALGFVLAAISSKVKNKSFVTVLLSLVFLGAYYVVCFNMSDYLNILIVNGEEFAKSLSTWAYFIYQLGLGATGKVVPFIIFALICIVLFGTCLYVLAKTFMKIVTRSSVSATANTKVTFKSAKNVRTTLLKRELKRFTSSSTYMLNSGLGVIFLLAIAVMAIIKKGDIGPLMELVMSDLQMILPFAPLAIICVICFITSINAISTPSISLEGKNLWILKSLPVEPYDVIEAKSRLHVLINGIPTIITSLILCYCLNIGTDLTLKVTLICVLMVFFGGNFGLIIGLLRPNFNWTAESQPIKQSVNVIISMLVSLALTVAIVACYFLLKDSLTIDNYLVLVETVLIVMCLGTNWWLKNKGPKVFELL